MILSRPIVCISVSNFRSFAGPAWRARAKSGSVDCRKQVRRAKTASFGLKLHHHMHEIAFFALHVLEIWPVIALSLGFKLPAGTEPCHGRCSTQAKHSRMQSSVLHICMCGKHTRLGSR
jgi:hypothetical protein